MLNPDGTVNLADAEYALARAQRETAAAYAACRTAERAYYAAKPYTLAKGRAATALDVARSNAEGAFEAEQRARGAVWEALNPALA